MKVLIVEDEKKLSAAIEKLLAENGYEFATAFTVEEAKLAVSQGADLILLDRNLPDGDGVDFLRQIRRQGMKVPVIFLTARADTLDKVLGLELGANDYITKPFEPQELLARIRVQARS